MSNDILVEPFVQGKVEAELILVTKEEASERPVGKARDEPEPLEAPKYANCLNRTLYALSFRFSAYLISILQMLVFLHVIACNLIYLHISVNANAIHMLLSM